MSIRYLFHLVLSDTPDQHLEHNILVLLLLSGCSTRTNDDFWRNWRSGNGCWRYITDCRSIYFQHCVLETRDLLTSCQIWIVYFYTAGCLRMLEEKCSMSCILLLRGISPLSWPFFKEGNDGQYKTTCKEKTVTQFSTRESFVHVLFQLISGITTYVT